MSEQQLCIEYFLDVFFSQKRKPGQHVSSRHGKRQKLSFF